MKFFYRFLLSWSQFDLAIARSTGRSPRSIADLSADVARWELELFNLDWRLK